MSISGLKRINCKERRRPKFPPIERRDPRPNGYGHNRPRRDFTNQPTRPNAQVVSSVFKEQVYQILEKIKMILTSNGQIKWKVTQPSAFKASIANTIRIRGTPPRIVEPFVTIRSN